MAQVARTTNTSLDPFPSSCKVKAALWLITEQSKGDVLQLDDIISSNNTVPLTVWESLESKHPLRHPAQPDTILWGDNEIPAIKPVVFDCIDAAAIRTAALRTDGEAGPSGIDACGWRRRCTSFQTASNDLCHY